MSSATVSNVLLGRNQATEAVADRVRHAAQELNYVADRSASHLRSGKARIVAVVVPSLADPFFTAVIAGIEAHAQASGYDTLVASSNHSDAVEATRLAALLSWRPSGVVVIPNSDAFPNWQMLDGCDFPCVVVDRIPPGFQGDSVAAANQLATADAAAHLLAHGHREILVVGSSFNLRNVRERYDGAAGVFREHGLRPPPKLEVGLSFETVAEGLAAWLSANRPPTAFLTLTNFVAMGVLAHLSSIGMRVPGDVSLVGFDDNEWMRAASPGISAVRQDVDAMAARAWAVLAVRMGGGRSPPQQHAIMCHLVLRGSVAPLVT